MFTDDWAPRRAGWYVPGKGHANDSLSDTLQDIWQSAS